MKNSYIISVLYKSLLSILLFLLFQSSGFSQKELERIPALSVNDTLSNREISFEGQTELFNPVAIVNVNDEYLVISDSRSEGIFQVFGLPDLDYLYSWGREGRGPNEFTVLPIREINTKNDEIILYDFASFQLRNYRVSDTEFVKTGESTLSFKGQLDPLTHIRQLEDSIFVADYGTSFEDTNHEHIVLKPGEEEGLFTFGEYPDTELENIERYFSYIKTNIAKPDGSKFAVFYDYHNMLKIYDIKGDELHSIRIVDPHFSEEETNKDRFRYRKAAWASDRYIYTLGLHATADKLSDPESSLTTSLEIWDWEGRPVYRAMFDQTIHGITVSEKHGKIYGYTSFIIDKFYEYELPDVITVN